MGIDYTSNIGLGKQIEINYSSFPYDVFYDLTEDYLAKKYPNLEVILTSQEYKGTVCSTTIFIGKILFEVDPRDAKTFDPQSLIEKLNDQQFSSQELQQLDAICQHLIDQLKLSSAKPSDFGINILVRAF